MALHRMLGVTIGVPDVAAAAAYYEEFGLTPDGSGGLATEQAGSQLRLAHSNARRLLEMRVGVEDRDDVARIAHQLRDLDIEVEVEADSLSAVDPGTAIKVVAEIAPKLPAQGPTPPSARPTNSRSPALARDDRVRPRKLGHVVVGSTEHEASQKFFMQGIGFKLSDSIRGEADFLRCSSDHHNLLVSKAPVQYLHHTAWEVDDIDEIGRGATAMLEGHPERHAWGMGRHYVGSNMFWYLRDPAGNFSEYYSDLDCILDDVKWTPSVFEGPKALYTWGPPPPSDWMLPEDIAAGMMGLHSE